MAFPYRARQIALDWDDTLNNTYIGLRNACAAAGAVLPEEGVFLTNENTQGILDGVLKAGDYMSERHVREHDDLLTQQILRAQNLGISVGICSHRGYIPNALEKSQPAFDQLNWKPDFIILLDPSKTPNKLAVLDETFGAGQYLLADDRPQWDAEEPLPCEVVLMDQAWNVDIETHTGLHRVSGLKELSGTLHHFISCRTVPETIQRAYGHWTREDEINYAIAQRALGKNAHSELDALIAKLKEHGHTPESWGAKAFETNGSVLVTMNPKDRINETKYQHRLLRAACGLPTLPIDKNFTYEWKSEAGGHRAIRYPQLTWTEDDRLLVPMAIMQPKPYYTGWVSTGTHEHEIEASPTGLIDIPAKPYVVYINKSRIQVEDPVKYAAEARRCLMVSIEAGTDSVTNLPVPAVIADFLLKNTILPSDVVPFLEFYQYALETWADRGAIAWRKVVTEWLSIPSLNGRTQRIVMILQQYTGKVQQEVVKLKVWVQTSPNNYLVNSSEGLPDAIKDYEETTGLEVRPHTIPTAYPTLLTFLPMDKVAYYTSQPLADVVQGVQLSQSR